MCHFIECNITLVTSTTVLASALLAVALPLLSHVETAAIVSQTLQYYDGNEVTLQLSVLLFQVKAEPFVPTISNSSVSPSSYFTFHFSQAVRGQMPVDSV